MLNKRMILILHDLELQKLTLVPSLGGAFGYAGLPPFLTSGTYLWEMMPEKDDDRSEKAGKEPAQTPQ